MGTHPSEHNAGIAHVEELIDAGEEDRPTNAKHPCAYG